MTRQVCTCGHGIRAHTGLTGRVAICGAWNDDETGPCGCDSFTIEAEVKRDG